MTLAAAVPASLAGRRASRLAPGVRHTVAAQRAVPGVTWNGTAGLASWERLIGQPRFLASALGLLAGITALLAGFGVLGVVSHLVARRTREIGIRIALGADRGCRASLAARPGGSPAGAPATLRAE